MAEQNQFVYVGATSFLQRRWSGARGSRSDKDILGHQNTQVGHFFHQDDDDDDNDIGFEKLWSQMVVIPAGSGECRYSQVMTHDSSLMTHDL